MTVTIWHNPRCGTSRQVLEALRAAGIAPQVVEYLNTPPDAAQIRAVLARMGQPARALLRAKEPLAAELGLTRLEPAKLEPAKLEPTAPDADADRLIAAMAEHPILIERPVVFSESRAMLCRPAERVVDFLSGLPAID